MTAPEADLSVHVRGISTGGGGLLRLLERGPPPPRPPADAAPAPPAAREPLRQLAAFQPGAQAATPDRLKPRPASAGRRPTSAAAAARPASGRPNAAAAKPARPAPPPAALTSATTPSRAASAPRKRLREAAGVHIIGGGPLPPPDAAPLPARARISPTYHLFDHFYNGFGAWDADTLGIEGVAQHGDGVLAWERVGVSAIAGSFGPH